MEKVYSFTSTIAARGNFSNTPFTRSYHVRATTTDEVTIKKLTNQERDRLRKSGGCFRCRKPGHLARDCTEKPQSRQIRQMDVADTKPLDPTTTTNTEPVSIARVIAMMSQLTPDDKDGLTKRMVEEGF